MAAICIVFAAASTPLVAQRGATGPIADLNNQARELSETLPEQSLAAASKAQAAAHEAGDLRGEAEAYNYIAYAHRSQSRLDLARTDAQESVRLYVQARDRWGEAQGYNTLGLIEADAGRFVDALENHLQALEIRDKDGDKEGLSYTFNNLGNIYRNMGDYQKALEFHQRGLELKVLLGNKSSEAYSHHYIGPVRRSTWRDGHRDQSCRVYKRLGRLPDAVAALNRATALVERLDAPLCRLREVARAVALAVARELVRVDAAPPMSNSEIERRVTAMMWAPAYLLYRPPATSERSD